MSDIKEINVQNPWFDYIKSGEKRIEGRLNKGTFKTFEKGDKIKIKNNDSYVIVRIKKIIKYNSFEEYLSQEGLKRTLPGIKTISEGVDIYHKFYTKEQENEFGILAISIKIIR